MKRLGYVLRLDFNENLKSLLWGSVSMLLVYLFFFWFAHNIGIPFYSGLSYSNEEIEQLVKAQCQAVGYFGAVAMYFCFLLTASRLYGREQKKQFRTNLLMLPATNLEKFLSRWLYMLVYSVVVGILTFIVADLLHMLWLSSAGRPVIAASKYFFGLWPGDPKWKILAINAYAGFIVIHSIYLFGGIFFRRYHFAVTSLFFVILSSITANIFQSTENLIAPSGVYMSSEQLHAYYMLVCVIFILGIVLFTWLSYRVFCRWQLTDRKYTNL